VQKLIILLDIDRRSNSSKTKYQTVNSLKTLLKTNDLIDIWRELNSNKRQFTWRRKDKSQASRIDYILVNKNFSSLVFFAFILLNVIVISLISTLSASHNSLQFFKSLLILEEYFNIMSFLNINIKDTIFTLVCLYAPNCKTTKNNFFKKVNTFLKDHGIGIPMMIVYPL
jgi:exonuclease III